MHVAKIPQKQEIPECKGRLAGTIYLVETMRGRPWSIPRATWIAAASAAAVISVLVAAPAHAQIQEDGSLPFWERVATPGRERFEHLYTEADALVTERAPGRRTLESVKLAQAEALLREALTLRPGDFRALFLLGDVQSIAGRPADAVATFERALLRAELPTHEAACWFRLGVERSKLGQYAQAVTDYDHQIALGEIDATAYANSAELLMALGRLGEAEDRYREAIRIDEQAPDRRAREHSLTLSYYGLAVALDRDEQPVAGREMMARAVALDPRLTKLQLAELPGSDVFFVPEGDVYYYLGLASEVAGRGSDATANFREFVARLPKSPWIPRAQAHLGTIAAAARARGGAAPAPMRVVAGGTVLSTGGIPAPLIDAAWHERPQLIDACLDQASAGLTAGARPSFRMAIELELDGKGAVTRATAKVPPPFDGPFARCVEAAVKDGLRVTPPGRVRPTHARMELGIAIPVARDEASGL
jgi:tetratricopeptide (TPR) repeat protein